MMTYKQKYDEIEKSKRKMEFFLELIAEEINKSNLNKLTFGDIVGDIECTQQTLKELTFENYMEFHTH